jgi:hypothetical protein
MKLSDPQSVVCTDESRFRVLIAGRRFGKTYLSITELAKFARFPDRKVMYIAPTFGMAKQTLWNPLKQELYAKKWVKKVNESELSVLLVNNSTITLRSADNYDSLRGIGLDFVVFDEFADIKSQTWTEVIRPALSDRQGHALFIGTPKGASNWSKDLYDRGLHNDDWASWQFTTLDGGNVTEEEIIAARDDLDERTFRQEYMASFETYSNVIYYNFDHKKLFKEAIEVGVKDILHIGMDFNVSPISAVVAKSDGKTIQVFDNIEIYGSNTQEMCDEIKERYPSNRIIVYPDASGGARSTKGISDHRILEQNGFVVKAPRRNPAVKDRINSVNAALENANGDTRLTVYYKCKRTIESLEKHTYKGDTRQPDKESGFDHLTDALGYLVNSILPIKRPESDIQSQGYYGAV